MANGKIHCNPAKGAAGRATAAGATTTKHFAQFVMTFPFSCCRSSQNRAESRDESEHKKSAQVTAVFSVYFLFIFVYPCRGYIHFGGAEIFIANISIYELRYSRVLHLSFAQSKLYLRCLRETKNTFGFHCCNMSSSQTLKCSLMFSATFFPSPLPPYTMYTLLTRRSLFAKANQLQVEASFHCTCSCLFN